MESLDTATEKKCVFITLLSQQRCLLRSLSFVVHVADNELVGGVFKSIELWNGAVSGNIGGWEIDGFLNMPRLILVSLSQIEKQKGGVSCDSKHISRISNSRGLGDARSNRVHRLGVFAFFGGTSSGIRLSTHRCI